MKNYVGRKIRGFRFGETKEHWWRDSLEKYIGVIGEITGVSMDNIDVVVRFPNNLIPYRYPISLIEPHLIEEESPEIPQLGEGVLMQVSDSGTNWSKAYIIARLANGRFLDRNKLSWKHARPIKQLPKYTHDELVEKLGHDFEYVK